MKAMTLVRMVGWLLLMLVAMVTKVDGGYRDIGCTLITEMSLKTAKCINLNLVKVPLNVETDVQILHLLKNQITSLEDESFVGLYSLQNLHLTENWISYISRNAFESLQNLQSLYLDSNMLKEVPRATFKHLKQLRILNLGYNPISHIRSDDFSYLLNLETLKFENCQVSSIDHSAFDWLPQLYEINMIGNQLSGLNWRLKTSLKKVSVLRLHNNPWVCDCSLKWLRLAVETIPNWSFGDNSPVCHAPSLLSGVYWKHLNAEKFACPSVIVTSSEQFNNSTNLEFSVGSNGSLECKAWGDPVPQIVWLKSNEKINANNYDQESVQLVEERDEIYIESGRKGMKSVLSLIDFRKADKDNYKCVAENSAGRSEVTYRVWVSEKKPIKTSNSKEFKVNLTIEVIVGIILGCFFLLGCLLFCLIIAVRKQKKAKKIVKRRKSNKKHQQLLYNENEKNFKMAERKDEWGDKFIDASLECDDETKEGINSTDKSDKDSFKDSLNKRIHIDKNPRSEKSLRSADKGGFFQRKEKTFFSNSNKYLKRKSYKKNNKPDILNNDNAKKEDTAHSVFNIRHPIPNNPTQPPTNSLPYHSTPACIKHSCQHQTTTTTTFPCITSAAMTFPTPPHGMSNDTNTKERHLREVNATSDTMELATNASASMSTSLIYNFPNADKVPLKTILKQPSRRFDENDDDMACLTAETTPTMLTTTCPSNTSQKYPQKNGRPPDIYATLPGRMSGKNLVNAQIPSVQNVKGNDALNKMVDDACVVNGPANNREIKEALKKPSQDTYETRATLSINALTHLSQTPTQASTNTATLDHPVSYQSFNAPHACIRSCIPPNNHAPQQGTTNHLHHQAMLDFLHSSNSSHPLCTPPQQAIIASQSSPGHNYVCADQSNTTYSNRCTNRRHCKLLSPQQQAQQHKQLSSKCYTSSHDVRQLTGSSRQGSLHRRNEVCSSTSLHDILSPPFKRKSPFCSPQNVHHSVKEKTTKMNHLDFGTAV